MYSLNIPVSAIRTKIRQNFERHRYVNQLNAVDVLLFQSHSEYQVLQNSNSMPVEELSMIEGSHTSSSHCGVGCAGAMSGATTQLDLIVVI